MGKHLASRISPYLRLTLSSIFKEIGPGQRISLVKLASDHFIAHARPLRLAIDISIWLFQIQAGKGGSNPALRTFYYRLLRLMSFNIHPLFVFDGPNKPLFKRNKKVGGPGVRVASVPEFLAKQLLKQFGFPWHVAPGEAEAECALLQREGIVDAVLSEDVDTLMFGSEMTLRNWNSEGTSKVPTHVNVYRATETKEKSGLERDGMILVALMSGGDYIPEGIPGCGPKVACDAARAGFATDLIALARRKDAAGLKDWRERFQHQLRTNEAKYFSRKNSRLVIPEDFPNQEVLGYYTHPCVSTPEKVVRLKESLKWDQEIDFAALRGFAADAFDWRCLGGAKKFIRNLAPAMLVRELRLRGDESDHLSQEAQEMHEKDYVTAIHGTRTHKTTDAELEYRITYIPMNLVPIDLSIEDEDDDFIPAGGLDEQSEADDAVALPNSTAEEEEEPPTPTKKRAANPYDPSQPEKIWIMHSFLKVGSPLLVEDYEASLRDPRAFFKARRKARAAAAGDGSLHPKKPRKKKAIDADQSTLTTHMLVTKSSQASQEGVASSQETREPLKALNAGANARLKKPTEAIAKDPENVVAQVSSFRTLSRWSPLARPEVSELNEIDETTPKAGRQQGRQTRNERFFASFAVQAKPPSPQKTPRRRKRPPPDAASPALSQRSIASYFSPTSKKAAHRDSEVINLVSSSPMKPDAPRATTPTPRGVARQLPRQDPQEDLFDFSAGEIPDSVTRRRKKGPLKRAKTAPTSGDIATGLLQPIHASRPSTPDIADDVVDIMVPLSQSTAHVSRRSASLDEPWLPRPASDLNPEPSLPQACSEPWTTSHHSPHSASGGVTDKQHSRSAPSHALSASTQARSATTRRSPRQQETKKKRIQLRQSLAGAWKEVEAEAVDMTEDGSGWKQSKGRANIPSWRKSGVEAVDLTGA